MELILKKDVDNLGFKDDIVVVKNGYGRNYLIPNGFAHMATSSAKKVLVENLKQRAFKEKKNIEDAQKKSKAISDLVIKLKAKSGSDGKLFGSVSNADISEALDKNGFEISRKFITIPGRLIKRTGKYNASIRLHRDVIFDFPFEIIAQDMPKKKKAAPAKVAPVKLEAKQEEE
jgi:large subunit ribosomal protein L9